MIQVDLKSHDGTMMTTWVEKRPDLHIGGAVRLDKEKNFRRIEKIYDLEIPKDQLDSNRNWDNNNYEKHDGTAIKDRK